jgi:ABC-type uncharacterized transport system YnjBCD ATPase subunit
MDRKIILEIETARRSHPKSPSVSLEERAQLLSQLQEQPRAHAQLQEQFRKLQAAFKQQQQAWVHQQQYPQSFQSSPSQKQGKTIGQNEI